MTQTWPQPYQGIRGTDLTGHWLLSLDERAIAHRETIIALGHHLRTATMVGQPAPVVARMSERMRHPEPGDLAVSVEVLHGRRDPDDRLKGLGVYLSGRTEWWESDAEWEASKAQEPAWADEDRATDTVFYLQYGPDPGDICRWSDSEAVALLTQPWSFGIDGAERREDNTAWFTRDSLIGGLADSGFYLKGDPGAIPENGEHLVTVHVPSGTVTEVRDVPAAARGTR